MDIKVSESVPGASAAQEIQRLIRQAGIQDVQLFFDKEIKMWCVCQVFKNKSNFILPSNYMEGGVRPLILWWCKDENSRFRAPNHNDFTDIMKVVHNAPKVWEKGGEARADKFDAQDAKRDEAHNKKQHERIKAVAPRLKKAIREELG